MPRVPTYDGPQARTAPLGASPLPTPDVTSSTRAAAQGLDAAAGALDRLAERQDQDAAWRAQAKINEDWMRFESEARKNLQGQNAAGYADKVKEWWGKASQDYGSALTPSQQKLISKPLMSAMQTAMKGALDFENTELERSRLQALDGALSAEISRGAAGGPSAAAVSAKTVEEMLQKYGASTGKPVEWVNQQVLQRTTTLHSSVISTLMQKDPKAAEQYFEANKGQIDGTRHDEIGSKINAVSAAADGDALADKLWQAGVKPGAPVELDKLEAAAREEFKNDPTRQKHAIQGLRERMQAFEKARAEREAAGINAVYKMLDGGVPMSRVQRMPEWQQLDGKSQDQILYQQEQRAAARESRAAAAENRALAAEARRDKQLLLTNAEAYLRYSDPTVLAGMSRQQVEATRATFGFEGAQHLLSRWDSLQKPGAIAEARMDQEDFNHIADQMGLKPYDSSKSEDSKRALGELKYRMEQLIDATQQAAKKPMTREEKNALMRGEMARTVTVNPTFWFSSEVPVIQLDKKQVKDVVVPQGDREQISQALKAMYERSGGAAIYAPTEDNVRRLYLMNKSRAAALLPNE